MAQYLDLTGLTYFKSKLLSSALNYDCNIERYDEESGDTIKQQIQIKANTAAQQNLDLIATDNTQYHRGTLSVNNTDIKLAIANYDYSLDWDITEGRSIGEFSCSDTLLKFYTSDGQEYRSGQSHDNIGDYEFSGTGFKISYNSNYDGVISITGNSNGLTLDSGNELTTIKTANAGINIKTSNPNTRGNINISTEYKGNINMYAAENLSLEAQETSIMGGYGSVVCRSEGGYTGLITLTAYGPDGGSIIADSDNFSLSKTSASFNLGTGTNHNFTVAANNFQVASNGDISKIRQLKGGTNNYIWFNGNDIVFHNGQGNEINLSTIIANIYTCLRGDTSYITMADRSRKLIQDIKPGDVVLSYDVNKKDYCEAVVLANDMTGMESRFDTFVFENGTTVDVYGDEPFIFEASDVLTIGTIQTLYDYHTKGDDRRWVPTHTPGAKARVIRKFSNVICEEPVGRYMLVTSNGAFFVNGMLKGNMSNFIDSYYKKRRNKLPDNIQTFLTEISHKLAAFDNGLEDDHVDATVLKQLEIKWSAVHNAKQFLTATDYKAMKYAEGAMTEEEWLPVKAQRAEMRAVINENEAEIAELRKQLPENLKQPTWIGKAQIWAECEGILNDHLQDFKDFIYERYPKTEE